ncbi:IS481 family transposase [bacterium]|nr:IS481 family transposase [bacterium]
MNDETRKRLKWIQLYEQTRNAGIVCLRAGISRPTLRKWWRRYQEHGVAGLSSQSRRPKHIPNQKVFDQEIQWILELRSNRNLGARRIQHELERLHACKLSLATIHKVLKSNQVKPLRKTKRYRTKKRYQRLIPGDRVQMDSCKIRPGLYQYTAVDDSTRFMVLGLFSRRTAANTLLFLDKLMEEMPFPIQRIQTDRGTEFTAYCVRDRLFEWGIKYRPIKPASPHLNGKVERAQQTVLNEFYPTVDMDSDNLLQQLEEWQFYYNWQRVHGSTGTTPLDLYCQKMEITPNLDDTLDMFIPEREEEIQRRFTRGLNLKY